MSAHKALLLTNGGHINLPGNRELIEDIFIRQAGLDVEVSHDPTELTRERLGAADVLLDYSGDPKTANRTWGCMPRRSRFAPR